MIDYELNRELERNNIEKRIINDELDASKKKWVEYLLKNKDNICLNNAPILVKKKKKAVFNDFVYKIKAILGLLPKKVENDGIETYLQYRSENV